MTPTVSVIIPTYNRANFISEAIESVLLQQYQDMEIIVIDDGSVDNTRDVLAPFRRKIRYFYQQNKGLGKARNRGIREARGKYIAFLDSDDRWLPDKISIQMSCFDKEQDLGLCCTNFREFDENGIIAGRHQESWEAYVRYNLALSTVFPHNTPLEGLVDSGLHSESKALFYYGGIFKYYFYGPLLLSSTAVLKRELALEAIPMMSGYSYTHDYFLFAYISKTHPVGLVDLCLCEKRSNIREKTGQAAQLTAEKHQIGLRSEYLRLTENLWRDDVQFYQNHKREVDHRLSLIHWDLGSRYLRAGNAKKARAHFMASIILKPFQKRVYLYLLQSYLKGVL